MARRQTATTWLGSTSAGSEARKLNSAAKVPGPSTLCSHWRMASILPASPRPRASPARVPTVPMVAPVRKKMRRMAPRDAPMVRRMAMSPPLSFTSITRLEMMLKAATTMIRVRMMNMALRSTCSAVKMVALASRQSVTLRSGPAHFRHLRPHGVEPLRIGGEDVETAGLALQLVQQLRRLQRHIDGRGIGLLQPGREDRGHGVGLGPRHQAEGGAVEMRRDQRQLVTQADAELPGQAAADGDHLGAGELLRLVDQQRPGDRRTVQEIRRLDPAHRRRRALEGGEVGIPADQRLVLDHRRHPHHAGNLPQPVGQRAVIRQAGAGRGADLEMGVEAEHALHQLGAEAVHHRHDDDQGRHAQQDAGEGEAGDDGDEAFLPAGPQVAEGDGPFEGR